MQRSGGITASVVIIIIGSAFTILFGAVILLTTLFLPVRNIPGPAHWAAIAAVESIFFFAFGAWGIASAIGLLRLKQWARISLLIFAAILVLVSLPSVLLFMFIPLLRSDGPHLPANFATIFRFVISAFYMLLAALGIFWLVFFNKRAIKSQFASEPLAAISPSTIPTTAPLTPLAPTVSFPPLDPIQQARPLSITVIAWFLLVGAASAPLGLLMNRLLYPSTPLPFFFLGTFLTGPTAMLILIAWMALQAAAAYAMLKLEPWGLHTTIGLQCFGALNILLSLTPSNRARFRQIMQSMFDSMNARNPYPVTFDFPISLAMAASIPFFAVILFFLITRRSAFLAASRQFANHRS